MSVRRRFVGWVALLLFGGCGGPPPPEDPSLILVTLDTTRADHLGAFGGAEVPTPNLDAVAREGAVFLQAITQVPLTLPAHASILTGKYPATHGVRHNGIYRLASDEQTLAEHLRESGYRTAGFVGAFVLNEGFGLEQGFDTYDGVEKENGRGTDLDHLLKAERTAEEVNRAVFAWLDGQHEGRIFLWVHYFDPHAPYSPPDRPGLSLSGQGYEREISYVDHAFGELVSRLRNDGWLDRSVLVVAGDHGESLGEHGEATHGILLYEGAVRVPLIFRAPWAIPAGSRCRVPVELVDIAPTVLDLLRLPGMPDTQGRTLEPWFRGNDLDERPVFAETLYPRIEYGWSELRMARDGRYKYIEAPRPELYDLRDDPSETTNLLPQEPDRGADWSELLGAWVARTEGLSSSGNATRELTPEDMSRLRSLGYLQGPGDDSPRPDLRPDPKDRLRQAQTVLDARALVEAGKAAEGLSMVDRVLADEPDNLLARQIRLEALLASGLLAEAEREALALLSAAERDPTSPTDVLAKSKRALATVYWRQGRNREAERLYREALDAYRDDPSAARPPGLFVESNEDAESALRSVQEVLERSPDDPNAWAARFELEIHLDRGEDALRSARMLARLGAGDADTLVRAGMLSREEGEHALAASLFAIAAEKAPNDAEIAGQAGVALLASGDIVRAEQQFLRARSLTPFDSRPTHFLAVIALGRNDEKEAVRYLKESDSRDPSGVATLLEYSRWLAERGRLVDATLKAEEALKRQPRNENIALWVERLREASRRDGS